MANKEKYVAYVSTYTMGNPFGIKIYDVDMPIVHAVYDVLYNGLNPQKAVTMLMTRDKKSE